jgi:pimeloyl-ACP methyl ester carboxylesterase
VHGRGPGKSVARDLGTSLQPIPGGKHFTPEDHPQVVADAVNELLGTSGGSGGQV